MKRKYKPCATMEISKGLYYITSTPGILKIFEFVALLISLSCIAGFISTMNNSRGTWNFFVFAVAATWIITIIALLFFTLGAHKTFSSINWVLAMAIIYFIFTVMLLIAGGILADNVRSYKVSGLCESWRAVDGDIECNNLVVAVSAPVESALGSSVKTEDQTSEESNHLVQRGESQIVTDKIFAFVAFVLYSLDTLFHFWLSVVVEPEASEDETAEMEPKEQPEPLEPTNAV